MKPRREKKKDQQTTLHDNGPQPHTVILDASRLGCRGPKGNFISLLEDRRLVLANLDAVDLHMKRDP